MSLEQLAQQVLVVDQRVVARLNTAVRRRPLVARQVGLAAERLALVEILLMGAMAIALGRRHAALRMLAAVSLVSIASEALGGCWPRARPFARYSEIQPLASHTSGRSFPSRHVASGLAMALVGRRAHAALGWSMMVVALGLGLSRLAAGLHYPSDVAAGALLGAMVGRMLRE